MWADPICKTGREEVTVDEEKTVGKGGQIFADEDVIAALVYTEKGEGVVSTSGGQGPDDWIITGQNPQEKGVRLMKREPDQILMIEKYSTVRFVR